jgi:hypothetical protein
MLSCVSEGEEGVCNRKYLSVVGIEDSKEKVIELSGDSGLVNPNEKIMLDIPNIDLAWLSVTILFSER